MTEQNDQRPGDMVNEFGATDPGNDAPTDPGEPDAITGQTAEQAEGGDDLATLADLPDDTPDNVASHADNAALTHTDESAPTTTRDDALDLGVPMLPGSPDEPTGPEDALGTGPKRGDYTGRLGYSDYHPTTSERIPGAKPGEPHTRIVAQRPNAEDIGDEPGKKGGVSTG